MILPPQEELLQLKLEQEAKAENERLMLQEETEKMKKHEDLLKQREKELEELHKERARREELEQVWFWRTFLVAEKLSLSFQIDAWCPQLRWERMIG